MKIEIIKYKCDVCGKEFDLKGGIKKRLSHVIAKECIIPAL